MIDGRGRRVEAQDEWVQVFDCGAQVMGATQSLQASKGPHSQHGDCVTRVVILQLCDFGIRKLFGRPLVQLRTCRNATPAASTISPEPCPSWLSVAVADASARAACEERSFASCLLTPCRSNSKAGSLRCRCSGHNGSSLRKEAGPRPALLTSPETQHILSLCFGKDLRVPAGLEPKARSGT